jgi:LacI family transcriptional regulator
MATTIRELAKKLNLSITTVSRALDGYEDVSEITRERVVQAAHSMGYTPNRAARQLRTQRTDSLGFILPGRSPRFTDPFFSEFIAGLGDAVSENEFDLLISAAPPGEQAEQELYTRWINARKVDGFILNRIRIHDWRIQFLVEYKVPFVTLEKSQDPFDYPCVTVDGKKGIQRLVQFLLKNGHNRIAFIGGLPALVITADRYQGYLASLIDASIPVDEGLIKWTTLSRDGGYHAANELLSLSTPPDAIVCANDLTALGVLDAARQRGIKVGKDLAVTGFDGIEEAAYSLPPLTTLSQSVYSIGQHMVRMLIALIKHEPLEEPCLSIEPELILRQSTLG